MKSLHCAFQTTSSNLFRLCFGVLAAICSSAAFVPASRAELYVYAKSSAENPALPRRFPPGSQIVLDIGLFPAPSGEFQWYHDGQAIPAATGSRYAIAAATTADTGNYQLICKTGSSIERSNTVTINILPAPPSSVDPTFTAALDIYARPYLDGIAADGSLLLLVESWADSTFKIVRLFADGTADPTFSYDTLTGGGPLAVLPNGGFITNRPPYRFNRDCSRNPLPLPSNFFGSSSGFLTAAAVHSEGGFVVAADNNVARFAADGTLDPNFKYAPPDSEPVLIGHLELDSARRIYVTAGTRKDEFGRRAGLRVFRLLSSGKVDSSFPVQQLGANSNENDDSIRVYSLPNGRLLRFDYIKQVATFTSFNDDGSSTPNWSVKVEGHSKFLIDPKHGHVFAMESATGILHAYNLTSSGVAEDPNFYVNEQYPADIALNLEGDALYLGGYGLKRVKLPAAVTPPVRVAITLNPPSPEHAEANTLRASIDSDQLRYEWLALDGQTLPTDPHSAELLLPIDGPANRGRYQLRVTGPTGVTLLSNVIDIDADEPVFLANLSGRGISGTGENAMIAGFTTHDFLNRIPAGEHSVPLLIRGVGPALGALGISNPVPNPVLTLYDRSGNVAASNDDWGTNADRDTLRTDAAASGAFALPENSLDASLRKPCYNQQFTAQLSDQTGQSGVGLLEIYRVPKAYTYSELTNLSLRASTGSGEHTAITGFVLTDPQNLHRSARVLLRVVGPTLASQGIAHPLADPVLTLFNNQGEAILRVDNWGDDSDVATLTATTKQVGAFDLPTGSKDAAVVLDLPAGVYTMHATGGEGVVLMEIYLVR